VTIEKVHIPDLGHSDTVDVIELCVKPGDIIKVDQSLAVLESAKASMEVPSPFAGKVVSVQLKLGDKVLSGTLVAEIETTAASIPATPTTTIVEIQPVAITVATVAPVPAPAQVSAPISTVAVALMSKSGDSDPCDIYAGPAVRKLARDLGVELKDSSPAAHGNAS
jgi:pyruvate dehydrogenase E2 component (dihydrolipoamide acetyltransferase)